MKQESEAVGRRLAGKAKADFWKHVQATAPEVAADLSAIAEKFGRLELGPAEVVGRRYGGDWK